MKNNILGTIAVTCLALSYASAQESGGFAPVAGRDAQAGSSQAQIQQTSASQQATTTTPLLLNVTGGTVKDESGQQVGQIQHLIVSPQGCVDMAVLSLGGTKLVPVPWQLVSVSSPPTITPGAPARTTLSLNVDRQKLQQAPSFSMNQISQIAQQQTIQQVFNFYGVQPNQSASVGASSSQSSSISGGTSSTNTAQTSSQTTTPSGTNQFGSQATAASTNQFGSQSRLTNQFGSASTNQFGGQISATNRQEMLSPTGRTNGYPGRPGVTNTNPPSGRPPFNRPPDNRPPTNTPPPRPFQSAPSSQPGQ